MIKIERKDTIKAQLAITDLHNARESGKTYNTRKCKCCTYRSFSRYIVTSVRIKLQHISDRTFDSLSWKPEFKI